MPGTLFRDAVTAARTDPLIIQVNDAIHAFTRSGDYDALQKLALVGYSSISDRDANAPAIKRLDCLEFVISLIKALDIRPENISNIVTLRLSEGRLRALAKDGPESQKADYKKVVEFLSPLYEALPSLAVARAASFGDLSK